MSGSLFKPRLLDLERESPVADVRAPNARCEREIEVDRRSRNALYKDVESCNCGVATAPHAIDARCKLETMIRVKALKRSLELAGWSTYMGARRD